MVEFRPNSRSITFLLRQVESIFGSPVDSPTRFNRLAEALFTVTGAMVSVSTLKRIWGYVSCGTSPRRTTLDVLSRYCGWADFKDFESGARPEVESGPVGTATIRPDVDLRKGDRVTLRWMPDRVCEIGYTGNRSWRVVSASGTRLRVGDEFHADIIISGEPLYLSELTRNGELLGTYVCGRKTGVTFTVSHE